MKCRNSSTVLHAKMFSPMLKPWFQGTHTRRHPTIDHADSKESNYMFADYHPLGFPRSTMFSCERMRERFFVFGSPHVIFLPALCNHLWVPLFEPSEKPIPAGSPFSKFFFQF